MLPRPASRLPSLCWARANGDRFDRCHRRALGGPLGRGFGTVYGANPPSPRGKTRSCPESVAWGNAQGAPPTRKYSTSAPSSWSVASIWPGGSCSIGLVARRRAPGRDAVVGGHPQDPQHVRPVRDEDRVGELVSRGAARRPHGSTRAWSGWRPRRGSRRPGRRGRSRRRGPRRPRSSGRRRPCRRSRRVRRDAGLVQLDGVVEPCREERRRPAVVLGRAQDDDRVGRALVVALALRPDPVRRVAGDARAMPRQPTTTDHDQVARDRCVASSGSVGSMLVAASALSARGTSCTSRRIRTSTDRCARSGRRSA